MSSPRLVSAAVAILAFPGVSQANEPPVARDNRLVLAEEVSRIVNVLVNDFDPEGEALSVSIATPPLHVSATVLPDGTIALIPPRDFVGVDQFLYRVADPHGAHAEAQATIFVQNTNDPPVARPDFHRVGPQAMVRLRVLDNDFDVDDDSLTLTGVTDPGPIATVSVGPNQELLFEARHEGVATFQYEIEDPHGSSSTASVEVAVATKPEAPR